MSSVLDRPGDSYPRHADTIINDEFRQLPPVRQQLAPFNLIYGDDSGFIHVGAEALKKEACQIRRARHADSRAQACEMAYDFMLAKGTEKKWERVGEVIVGKVQAVALCQRTE